MEMKIPLVAISAFVVVVVLAAVLMPVLNDATDTDSTFTNKGLWRMKAIEDGNVWTYSDDVWSYNGDAQTVDIDLALNAIVGDDWCVRANGQGRGSTLSGNASTITATAGETVITFTGLSGASTQSLPGYGVDAEGSYLLKDPNKKVFLLGDSVLYGTGLSTVDNAACIVHLEGDIDNGVTIAINSNAGSATISNAVVSNIQINTRAVNGYEDLYEFESVTADVSFDRTQSGTTTSHSGTITYNSIVVPYEVTADKTVTLTANESALLLAIPTLVIVALLIGVLALYMRSKMD